MCCVTCSSFGLSGTELAGQICFPSLLLPSGCSWSLWGVAPWPRSVDEAEEAGTVLTESEICVRLAQETMLVIEG